MSRIHEDTYLSIDNFPLVRLNQITEEVHATVLAEIKGRNPAYSVKCRIEANSTTALFRGI
jgi:cysteine synthase